MTPVDSAARDVVHTLRQQCEALLADYGIPGMSVALTLGPHMVFEEAFGYADLAQQTRATAATVYPIGSITKVFIVTALMQLVERGRARLDDLVSWTLPEYRVRSPFPYTRPTTLLQLASHTAGLPRDAAVNFPMNASIGAWVATAGSAPLLWYVSREALLAALPQVELAYPPDSGKYYSNLGVALLGIAVERQVEMPLDDYLQAHVFGPLGMRSSSLVASHADLPSELASRLATGYVGLAPGTPLCVAPPWQLGSAAYSGGICCTAGDLARFLAFYLDPDAAYAEPVLRPETVSRMCPAGAFGDFHLGWWKGWHGGYSNYGHSGGHLGFMAATLGIPDLALGATVLTDRFNPISGENHAVEIAQALLSTAAPYAQAQRAAQVSTPQPGDLEAYAGTYELRGSAYTAEVAVDGDRLSVTFTGLPYPAMTGLPAGFAGADAAGELPVAFRSNSQGQVEALEFALFTFTRPVV